MTTLPPPLQADALEAALDRIRALAASRADVFDVRAETQLSREYAWSRGDMRAASEARNDGVSVRVYVRGHVGFASTRSLSAPALERAVEDALRIAEANARRGGLSFPHRDLGSGKVAYRPRLREDPFDAPVERIAELLSRGEQGVQGVDAALLSRIAFATKRRHVRSIDSAGRRADAVFSLSTILAYALKKDPARPGDGSEWRGGEMSLEAFNGESAPEELGARAARYALESARAQPAPVGRHRVLCDNTLTGLLAHESFGHLTEYDVIALRWSRLHGRLGERFADEGVSIVDAPVVPHAPDTGIALPIDEEGVEGRAVRVLDQGVLAHWLHMRGSAGLAGHEPTGNGRAMNAACPPLVRMRNTYFEGGDLSVEEALEELGDGVYLLGGQGGAPSSGGEFMFTASRGYIVKDGQLEAPLRPTAVAGNIFEFLRGVRGLTREVKVSTTNFGGCGKWGQSYIPVGVGGPHVLVESAQVGGIA